MFKKTFILAAAALLVGGLLFGRKLVPYAGTAFEKAQHWANDQVDTNFKIDAARRQLAKIENDIEPMLWQIAKEEVAINQLTDKLGEQDLALARSHDQIMKLRDHLASGASQYVSASNRTYSNDRVRQDLANRFEQYKLNQSTLEKTQQILDLRRQGLGAAKQQLEETIAQRRELEVQIENLEARSRMVEVAKTAGKINKFDSSELSRTREMIEDIKTRLDVETQMMNIAPQFIGEIPMDDEATEVPADIIDAVDAYFAGDDADTVAKN